MRPALPGGTPLTSTTASFLVARDLSGVDHRCFDKAKSFRSPCSFPSSSSLCLNLESQIGAGDHVIQLVLMLPDQRGQRMDGHLVAHGRI